MVLTSTPREKAQFIEQAAVQGRSWPRGGLGRDICRH